MTIKKPTTYYQWSRAEKHLNGMFNRLEGLFVQRPVARLIANDIVTVQPMDIPLPRGELYFFDFVYNPATHHTIIEQIPKPVTYKLWKDMKELAAYFVGGRQIMDVGYIWAPYLPMMLEPEIINEPNPQLNTLMRSRYARATINPNFYEPIEIP